MPSPLKRQAPDTELDYALWWVSRWISGSMDDPDWSWAEAETLTVEDAFAVVNDRIGNANCVAGPFWRYIAVSDDEAARLMAGGALMPHESTFQSFTDSEGLASEIGEELARPGERHLLVRVDVPADCAMFSLGDLQGDPRANDTLKSLDLWHHQREIFVKVARPLQVLEVREAEWSPSFGFAPSP